MTQSVIVGAALLAALLIAGVANVAGPIEAADLARDPAPSDRAVAASIGEPVYRNGVVMHQLSGVGGIAEFPDVARSAQEMNAPSGRGRVGLAVVGAGMVMAVLGLSAGAWYAGRSL